MGDQCLPSSGRAQHPGAGPVAGPGEWADGSLAFRSGMTMFRQVSRMQEHNQLYIKEAFHRNMPERLWNKGWGTSGSSALSGLGGEVEAADMNKYQDTRGNKEA